MPTPTRRCWKEIVELAVDTSIRRNVKPQGIPNDESCKAVAIHNAGAIPEFAKLLGYEGAAATAADEDRSTSDDATPAYSPRIVSSRAFQPRDSYRDFIPRSPGSA